MMREVWREYFPPFPGLFSRLGMAALRINKIRKNRQAVLNTGTCRITDLIPNWRLHRKNEKFSTTERIHVK